MKSLEKLQEALHIASQPRMDNSHQLDLSELKRLVLGIHQERVQQLIKFAEWLEYNGKYKLPEDQVSQFLKEQT